MSLDQEVEFLSLQEALEESGPLYILNTSETVHPPGGDVFLNIPRPNGGTPIRMTVPLTWLPQDLSSKAPRMQILDSPYFMDALSNRLIGIISRETAVSILQQPGADDERARLQDFADRVKAATASKGIGKNTSFTVIGRDDDDEPASQRKGALPATPGRTLAPYRAVPRPSAQQVLGGERNVSVRANASSLLAAVNGEEEGAPASGDLPAQFRGWAMNLNNMSEKDAATKLIARNTLTHAELSYITENVTHPNIKRWAQGQLSTSPNVNQHDGDDVTDV